ncbi:MAG: type I methionyl aminopeptidase [Chloroflexi bacterium]|nr:type I methionyl aminopeptidase [Chloroflexota bacterium]
MGRKQSVVPLKGPEEIERMRRAGRIVAQVLAELQRHVRPGVTTRQLDKMAEELLRDLGGVPSFKGYYGYPATICASINEEVVHGIPGPRALKPGDIVTIDVGAIWEGYQGDAAITVPVGEVEPRVQALLEATQKALAEGISAARAGRPLGAISHAIESVAKRAGLAVVREYGGHGIGQKMHEPPNVPNWGPAHRGIRLLAGMTLALEPMLTLCKAQTRVLDDRWTVVTVDGCPAAHFEHTIAITEDGAEILTRLLEE